MRAIPRSAALAVLAGAAVVAGLLALSHGAMGTIAGPRAPLIVSATFDPPAVAFGDRITAAITVELDRRRARAQTLRLRYRLAPLQRIGAPRTRSVTRGAVELVTVTVAAVCITDACLAAGGVAQLRLAPVKASITTATGVRTTSTAWAPLAVRDRLRAGDLRSGAQPPLEADASPLAPSYRAAPATLATVLDVAAALLGLSAVGLAAWELERLTRRRREAPEGRLARAIRLARSAGTLRAPERRRALELLARALPGGRLQGEATKLAWAEPTPEPAEVEALVAAIEHEEMP